MFDMDKVKKLRELLESNEFTRFSEKARTLEHKLMDVISAEDHGDLRIVVAALGPLIAKAIAHLTPIVDSADKSAFIVETFRQLTDLAVDHYKTCEHMKDTKDAKDDTAKPDPYAPPSPVTH